MILIPATAQIPRFGIPQRYLSKAAGCYMAGVVLLVVSAAVYFGHEDLAANGKVPFDNPLKPSQIYLLTYLLTALFLAFTAPRIPRQRDGIMALMLSFAALHLAWMPLLPKDPVIARTLVLRLNVVAMAVCCQILLSLVTDMRPLLRAVRIIIGLTVAINVIVILLPQVTPFRMTDYSGRAAGLYGNPNLCATFLAMLMPLATVGQPTRRRIIIYLFTLIGVFLTFSRGGIIIWALAVLLDLIFRPGDATLRLRSMNRNALYATALGALMGLLIWVTWFDLMQALKPFLNTDTLTRLKGGDQGSSAERWIALHMGIEVFQTHPFVGAGYAATRIWDMRVSTHNMFVLMLAEFGALGGLWYLLFLKRIFSFPCRFGMVIGTLLAAESIFTHSYFDLAHYCTLILVYWRVAALHVERHRSAGAHV